VPWQGFSLEKPVSVLRYVIRFFEAADVARVTLVVPGPVRYWSQGVRTRGPTAVAATVYSKWAAIESSLEKTDQLSSAM